MHGNAGLLINGKLVQGGATLDVINPATGKVFTTVSRATEREAAAAVACRQAAQRGWAALELAQRRALLQRFADELHDNAEDLAATLVLEQGKPLAEARQELQFAEAFVRHIAGLGLPVRWCRTMPRTASNCTTSRWAWWLPSRRGTSRC